jgi:hypothetical protein
MNILYRNCAHGVIQFVEMLDAWAQSWTAPAMVLGYRAVADDPEAPLADLTVSATSVWPGVANWQSLLEPRQSPLEPSSLYLNLAVST